VLTAYAHVATEVDGLIQQAKAQAAGALATHPPGLEADAGIREQFPLSRRDIAGIAGEIWLSIRNAASNQQLMSVEFTRVFQSLSEKHQRDSRDQPQQGG